MASKLGETRPHPRSTGTGRGWGQLFQKIRGQFGVGTAKKLRGELADVPENPRILGTGIKITFTVSMGMGRG